MATLGIEEEVFITEPERPTLRSLYYLSRLLARNPAYYYTHSAHNFTRGKDVKQGLMSGVEISTGVHQDVDELVDDLAARRADLAAVASGLIVPVGHLINFDTPTNTCAIHIHVGDVPDKRRVYYNLIHFLPILPVFTINSPMVAGRYFGQSYRMHKSFAIGPILEDWTIRFQDVILSKRLGTVELRACDPCWDVNRIRYLLRAVKAIAELDVDLEPNISSYNAQRERMCREGLREESESLVGELKEIADFPVENLTRTASDELREMYDSKGLLGAYSALDSGYRSGRFEPRDVSDRQRLGLLGGMIGFCGYFIPRFPYYAWKGFSESKAGRTNS